MKRRRGLHGHFPIWNNGDDDDEDDDFHFREKKRPFHEFPHGHHGWNYHGPHAPHGPPHGPHEFFSYGSPHFGPNDFYYHGPHHHGPPHHGPYDFPPFPSPYGFYPQPYNWPSYRHSHEYPEPNEFFQQRSMTQGYEEPNINFLQNSSQSLHEPRSNITINVNLKNDSNISKKDIQNILQNQISSSNYSNNFQDINNKQFFSSNSQKFENSINPIREEINNFNENQIYNSQENMLKNQINREGNLNYLRNMPPGRIIQNNNKNDINQKTNNGEIQKNDNKKELNEPIVNDINQVEENQQELNEPEIPDIKHKHPLNNIPNLNATCTICHQTKENKEGFKCNECEVILCKDCSERIFYGKKKTTLHPHSLILCYRNNYQCDICKISFNSASSFCCEPCNFDSCISCYIPI